MGTRRRLLFVSPVVPAESGNGLAMRAGLFLRGLAADHEITVLVVPVAGAPPQDGVPAFVRRHAARTVVLDLAGRLHPHLALILRVRDPAARDEARRAFSRPLLAGAATGDTVPDAARRVGDAPFDVVHVMRLYLAPFAEPWLGAPAAARPRCVLDLDEDEVEARRRLAALHAGLARPAEARREAEEAERYARLADQYLPRFDRVVIAAGADGARVAARHGLAAVVTVPNAVRVPDRPRRVRPRARRLLFVGSLGYAPNADAARLLCEEILPAARRRGGEPLEVQLVGSRPPPDVARLAALPGVRLAADAARVGPYYAAARVATAPIRAGGGTRLKVLEALARGCPVVATPLGAEGLEVRDGAHLLLADAPDDFAGACVRLLDDDGLAERLRDCGWELVRARYALPVVAARLRRLYREL
jgi:glycosyltransferase involved in cell wall biosynthesis